MNPFALSPIRRAAAVAALLIGVSGGFAATSRSDLVVLDETGVRNLRIQTVVAEPGTFEETIFALGQIDVYPGKRAVISSRIPGRALTVNVRHDHRITQGEVALVVESRQFGEPPPQVTVTSPITGLVSAAHVVPGQPVEPDAILAEVLDLTEVYALAQVPDHLVGRLKPGMTARIRVAAVPDQVFEAELEHFGATADANNGTIEAAFHVDNPAWVLRPGMRAEFSIVVSRRTDVVSVPRSALQGDPAGRFVYVRDFDLPNAFIKTPVVVGQISEQAVEIVSGLLPADEVVTRGAYSLAFAGAGTVSLKAALDAAHGHEHNEDGSEITAKGNSATAGATETDHDHDHDHGSADGHDDHGGGIWMIVSGILLVALLVVGFRRRDGTAAATQTSVPPTPEA